MLQKRITDRAKIHMSVIRAFTKEQWGPAQSVKYMKEIYARIDLLARKPQLGVDHSDELGNGIHSFFIGSHTIYYQYDTETLIIRAVLHQAMSPVTHLRQKEK
jgi:toxin ParE1/3/4